MSGKTNEALYNEVMAFALSSDSAAAKAALNFARRLRGSKFKSQDFNEQCVAFLTGTAVDINDIDNEDITKFIEQCADRGAGNVVTRMVDIYLWPSFDIDINKLSHIAVELGKNEFTEEAARCFTRAGEMVNKD